MSYIQLPDGLKKKVGKIQLNVPKDEKTKDLFATLPYPANLKDPILQNRVEDLLKNREDLQKYLLATEDLSRTLEESLQLAVSHGRLNDETAVRHVSERDDPKSNYFRKNDNPSDVVYKEQAKFDTQNPIIGSLLKQIHKSKPSSFEEVKKILDQGPDPRAFHLKERFNKIFEKDGKKSNNVLRTFCRGNDDDVDDGDDSPPGSLNVPPAPPRNPTGFNPFEQASFNDDLDPDPLIRSDREKYFPFSNRIEGRDYSIFDEPDFYEPEKINLDGNLREVFQTQTRH